MLKIFMTLLLIAVSYGHENEKFSISKCQEIFCHAVLKQHNAYRWMRGASPLQIDSTLSEGAQQYAERIAEQEDLAYSSSNGAYGENLLYVADETLSPSVHTCSYLGQKVSEAWYNEIKDYDFENPNQVEDVETREFTQMVWKKSSRLGCGIGVASSQNEYYIVVRYTPKGNVAGAFDVNVPKKESIRHLIMRRIIRPKK